jgi:hypothetical protein
LQLDAPSQQVRVLYDHADGTHQEYWLGGYTHQYVIQKLVDSGYDICEVTADGVVFEREDAA